MTPCWWMPASWAKALRETIGLLGCGNTPVTCDSRRLVRYSSRVSTLQRNDASCGRTWLAITISSSAALPARSPLPLTVHSPCPRPPAPAQVLGGGAAGVFGRELDVVGVAAGPAHGGAGQLEAIVPSDLQLVLQVDVGRRNEDVNAPARGRTQRLAREIDVLVGAARQRRQHRTTHLLRDLLHTAVIAGRGRREAGLDDVDVERIELTRHLHLFLGGHGVAGGLLPVAQRGVEDDDVSDHEVSPLDMRKQNAADLGDPRRLLACPTRFSLASRYWPARRDPRVVQSGPGAGPAAAAEARRPIA